MEGPDHTPSNPIQERLVRWMNDRPRGEAFGRWVSRTVAMPQLRRLADDAIPWAPLRVPTAHATVALVGTGGVHLRSDPPFVLRTDASFRVIPRTAEPGDLRISHQAYDRRDALQDINLVFPLERLRELEAEGAIGRVADDHYGFGLAGEGGALVAPGREVGRRLREAGVDLALFVPA
jgi:D-proline reductase (dithiol) PrdB